MGPRASEAGSSSLRARFGPERVGGEHQVHHQALEFGQVAQDRAEEGGRQVHVDITALGGLAYQGDGRVACSGRPGGSAGRPGAADRPWRYHIMWMAPISQVASGLRSIGSRTAAARSIERAASAALPAPNAR